jgi:hypothetical protein
MKRTLKQELEYSYQPQYKGSNYPSISGITYGGSCPLPTHNATKWKMLNGGYGAEQQKTAQEKVAKNIRWLNNSFNSQTELEDNNESQNNLEIENNDFTKINEPREQSEITELERALARIKELEELNKQKDDEIDKIVKTNNENMEELLQENMKKSNLLEEQNNIIQEQLQTMKNKDLENKILKNNDTFQKEQISELKEEKKFLREKVIKQDIKLDKFEEKCEQKDEKIDELQKLLHELNLKDNPKSSENSSFEMVSGSEGHSLDVLGDNQ